MPVSDTSPHSTSSRFPVWSPLLVMTAVLLTGLVIGWGNTGLPTGYFVLFAAAMVVCTLFVEPRGLFLTVASFPLWFVVGTFIVALIAAPSGGSGKAKLATSAYPVIEHYLWLAIPMIVCIVLGGIRWWLYREKIDRERARATQRRRRQSDANRSNEQLSRRARSRSTHRRSATSGKNVPFDPARFEQRRREARDTETRRTASSHRAGSYRDSAASRREGGERRAGGSRVYSREELRSSSERRRGVPERDSESTARSARSSSRSAARSSAPSAERSGSGSARRYAVPEPAAPGEGPSASGATRREAPLPRKESSSRRSPLPPSASQAQRNRDFPRSQPSEGRWYPPEHYLED